LVIERLSWPNVTEHRTISAADCLKLSLEKKSNQGPTVFSKL
jgi:hypothetical protein